MGLFKKIRKGVKKVRKALHLPAITIGNVAKVAAVAGTGGIGAGALGAAVLKSKLKSAAVGGVKQVLRDKASRALAKRLPGLAPAAASAGKATTMPGGARIVRVARSVGQARKLRRMARRSKGNVDLGASKPARAKRRPPAGGKDFKALSVSWRAAGKPGRWIDWVKSH